MSDGGKGSTRRPTLVPKTVVDTNWDAIFGKDLEKKKAVEEALDDLYDYAIQKKENKNEQTSK